MLHSDYGEQKTPTIANANHYHLQIEVYKMYVSKKQALRIATLINTLEVAQMMRDKYDLETYIGTVEKATKELFDMGIPMVTLRGEK